MATTLDKYSNFASLAVTPKAVATGTNYARLETGLTNQQKEAWAIERIEYEYPKIDYGTLLATNSKYIFLALSNALPPSVYKPVSDPATLDYHLIQRFQTPAALGDVMMDMPYVHDFSGNPRLFIPQNVYMNIGHDCSAVLGVTMEFRMRIWYKIVELSSADWYDLLQLRMPLSM